MRPSRPSNGRVTDEARSRTHSRAPGHGQHSPNATCTLHRKSPHLPTFRAGLHFRQDAPGRSKHAPTRYQTGSSETVGMPICGGSAELPAQVATNRLSSTTALADDREGLKGGRKILEKLPGTGTSARPVSDVTAAVGQLEGFLALMGPACRHAGLDTRLLRS
jgi:hypothetical protein